MSSTAARLSASYVASYPKRPLAVLVPLEATVGPDLAGNYATPDDQNTSALVQSGFALLGSSMQQMADSSMHAASLAAGSDPTSPHSRWQHATAKTRAASSAADMTAAVRLKALQKTPLPMVIARIKVLLERLSILTHNCRPATAPATLHARPSSRHSIASLADGYASAMLCNPNCPKASISLGSRGTTTLVNGSKTPPSRTRTPGNAKSLGSKGAKGMLSSSGGTSDCITAQLSLQAVLQELEVMFGFVSEFLARVPQETRLALATVARLENYKKDQIIYDVDQQAENFYIILSGRIDIWSHPPGCPRPKTTVSVLRKGDTFGDQAIINRARHSTAASPGCNASLLVVSQEDFLTVFGPYFQGVAASWTDFLLSSVSAFKAAQLSEVQQLCSAMVSSKPPPNKEFDLQQDQVFFIKEGTFELQLIHLEAQKAADTASASAVAASLAIAATTTQPARHESIPNSKGGTVAATVPANSTSEKAVLESAAAAAGLLLTGSPGPGDLPTLGTHGVLASIRVKDGRALGTLGFERELRKQRHACVPRKTVAMLGPGSWFGGGTAIYGSGPIQPALRVVAKGPGPFELIHLPLEGIEQHGRETLIRRLRDDAAFTCTYYLGRLGLLPIGTAVGHSCASLLSATAAATELTGTTPAPAPAASTVMAPTASAVWGCRRTASMPGTPKQSATAATVVMGTQGQAGNATTAAKHSLAQSTSSTAVARGVLQDTALNSGAGQAAAPASEPVEPVACAAGSTLLSSSTLRRTGKQRPKYVHVAGSGVYSPGAMAALQHVQSLQAEYAASKKPAGERVPQPQQPAGECCAATGSSSSTVQAAGATGRGIVQASVRSSSRPSSSVGRRASVVGSTSNQPTAASAGGVAARSSAVGAVTAAVKVNGQCVVDGAVTAAERYWAQPGHSSSSTTAVLNPLLSSLFTDGLQPLVQELDGLMSHAQTRGRQVPRVHALGANEAVVSASSAAADSLTCHQPPASSSHIPYTPAKDGSKNKADRRPCSAAVGPASSWIWGGVDKAVNGLPAAEHQRQPSTCAGVPDDVLQHRPYSSLLAATVMWQRSSDLSFRPPLRQCLTSAEIDQQPLDRVLK